MMVYNKSATLVACFMTGSQISGIYAGFQNTNVPGLLPWSASKKASHLYMKKQYAPASFLAEDIDLDRRNMLGQTATVAFALLLSSVAADAAVPTMDDYAATTTGAQVGKGAATSAEALELAAKLGTKVPVLGSIADLQVLGSALQTSFNALGEVVEKADWAGVRSALRSEAPLYQGNALGMVRKPYFGLKGGEKSLIAMFKGDATVASKVEDEREDLAFSLSELEDFALENRSVFFNSLDQQQVGELIAESGFKENIQEGKNLFQTCRTRVNEFQTVVSKL